MSRPASGDSETLKSARQAIASAQTAEQLRQVQAVVLPLDHSLSLADTARVIGVSPGWACQLRRRFMHGNRGDDLNARDENGLSPLMLSAARNKPTICKLLLEAKADVSLLDPSGKTALAIAVAAGAHESIAIFESAALVVDDEDPSPVPLVLDDVESSSVPALEPSITLGSAASNGAAPISTATPIDGKHPAEPENTSDFDSCGWEPEEDRPPPDADSWVAKAASGIQVAITRYEPIDTSADWEDIDAYLPERSQPLTRTDDAEARARLRLLLLRAVREDSVLHMAVEALSINDDRSANSETESLLSMLVNDLGAEIDERFEYASATENFEVLNSVY